MATRGGAAAEDEDVEDEDEEEDEEEDEDEWTEIGAEDGARREAGLVREEDMPDEAGAL